MEVMPELIPNCACPVSCWVSLGSVRQIIHFLGAGYASTKDQPGRLIKPLSTTTALTRNTAAESDRTLEVTLPPHRLGGVRKRDAHYPSRRAPHNSSSRWARPQLYL